MKKSIVGLISLLSGAAAGASGVMKIMDSRLEDERKMTDKYLSLFLMMNQWVRVKQEGKNLLSYFERNGYREIAIYGMGYAGRTLVNEFINSAVKVRYCIDQNANIEYEGLDILLPEDPLEPVDAIVVTPIAFFADIEKCLEEKTDCPIVSLEDILYEV